MKKIFSNYLCFSKSLNFTGQNLVKTHPSRVTPIIQCIELVDYLAAVGVGHTNAFLHNFFKSGFLGFQALHYYQKTAQIKSDA